MNLSTPSGQAPNQPNPEWLVPRDFPQPTNNDIGGPTGSLRWLGRVWDWFWFSKTDPLPLGVIRIFTGLLVVYIHLVYSNQLLNLVGADAWIDHDTMKEMRHWTPFQPPATDWREPTYEATEPYARGYDIYSVWFHVTDPGWIVTVHIGFLVAMMLFAAGFQTRIMGVIAWVGMISYIQRAPTSLFGMDTIMNILMIYLIIGPSGATLSVDRWLKGWWARRHGRPVPAVEPTVTANFALRLMQIHFCIIYFASGCSKLQGPAWWNGTAMWGTLANYEFTPLNWEYYQAGLILLCQNRWLWEIFGALGCLFTLALEIGFPFIVWWRPTRWLALCGAVILHTGIGYIMGLSTFSLFMLCLLLAFVPAETMHGVLARLRSPRGVGTAAPRPAPAVAASPPPEAVVAKV